VSKQPEMIINWAELDWTLEERCKARHIVSTEAHKDKRHEIANKYREQRKTKNTTSL
jgi:hypothetical protein